MNAQQPTTQSVASVQFIPLRRDNQRPSEGTGILPWMLGVGCWTLKRRKNLKRKWEMSGVEVVVCVGAGAALAKRQRIRESWDRPGNPGILEGGRCGISAHLKAQYTELNDSSTEKCWSGSKRWESSLYNKLKRRPGKCIIETNIGEVNCIYTEFARACCREVATGPPRRPAGEAGEER